MKGSPLMDGSMDLLTNPTFLMFNSGLAGLYNLIPGVRELFTGSYHGSYAGYEAAGMPQEYLDHIRRSAILQGWW